MPKLFAAAGPDFFGSFQVNLLKILYATSYKNFIIVLEVLYNSDYDSRWKNHGGYVVML